MSISADKAGGRNVQLWIEEEEQKTLSSAASH